MPSVSIIITTHNRVELLKRAIDSALAAGSDLEVIVVDDASTDETEEYCRSRDDIKYVRLDQNVRTAGARNAGIAISEGRYIGFLDDDDWRLPGSLDKQVSIFEEDEECGVVYGQSLLADQQGNITDSEPLPKEFPEGDVFWKLLTSYFLGCLTVLFKKETIERVGLLDTSPNMYGVEDLDLWIRIAEFYKFRALKEPVAVYRLPDTGSGQWSSNQPLLNAKIAKGYKDKWLKLPRVLNEPSESLDKKTDQILQQVSGTMLYDMVHHTEGTRPKLEKAFMAVRYYPANLRSFYFYKTFAVSMLRSGKQDR